MPSRYNGHLQVLTKLQARAASPQMSELIFQVQNNLLPPAVCSGRVPMSQAWAVWEAVCNTSYLVERGNHLQGSVSLAKPGIATYLHHCPVKP